MKFNHHHFLLAFSILAATYFFLISPFEIKAERKGNHLIVKAMLDGEHDLDLKLTFDTNRAKILEKTRLIPYLCCNSFSIQKMKPFRGITCLEGKSAEKVLESSLKLDGDQLFEQIQLIASADKTVSTRGMYDGLLGISPLSFCNESEFSQDALIHQMRRGYDGFTIDIPRLIFTSEFSSDLNADFIDDTFVIKR